MAVNASKMPPSYGSINNTADSNNGNSTVF